MKGMLFFFACMRLLFNRWTRRIALCALVALAATISYKFYHKNIARPYLTVVGYINMADGIGRQSVELIDALKEEVSINFRSTTKPLFQDVPERVKRIVENSSHQRGKVLLYEDVLWMPRSDTYKKHLQNLVGDDQIRIAYSMFESSKIPSEWVVILNRHFDAVAVPDKFLIDVYKNSGVNLPIFELPLGLDLKDFLKQPLKTKQHKPFVFANLSTCLDRKNHLTLLRAFAKTFGNDPNVSLLINSRYGDIDAMKVLSKEMLDLGLTNVTFTQFSLDKQQYLDLFKQVDCYVSLSKGEGFSIQPREAMALGIPTIVSDSTAQRTICNSNLARVVLAPLQTSAYYHVWGGYIGYGYECKVEDAAAALRDVYDHYDSYLQNGPAARAWVQQYTYHTLMPYYRSLVKPKKVLLGSENKITPDYLMTNSPQLFKKYNELVNP